VVGKPGKLDSINWDTLTREEAQRLIPHADRREQALARLYNDGADNESEWMAAFQLWEDLRVYALCGIKPGHWIQHCQA